MHRPTPSIDWQEIRRKAVQHELRQRCQRQHQPSSPGTPSPQAQRRRRARSMLQQELLRKFPKSETEKLGEDCLKNINEHKSLIASLRPARRKIKWNSQVSDWDRIQQPTTRISKLGIDDLQIHGKTPLQRQESNESIEDNPGGNIDILERNIRRCFKSIQRVKKETALNQSKTQQTEAETIELRKSILAMSVPQRQTMKQSQTQLTTTIDLLKAKLTELDEQIGMLKMQKNSLEADTAILQELVDTERRSKPTLRRALSLDEASDILSVLSTDVTDDGNHFPDLLYTLDMPYTRSPSRREQHELGQHSIVRPKPAAPAAA